MAFRKSRRLRRNRRKSRKNYRGGVTREECTYAFLNPEKTFYGTNKHNADVLKQIYNQCNAQADSDQRSFHGAPGGYQTGR